MKLHNFRYFFSVIVIIVYCVTFNSPVAMSENKKKSPKIERPKIAAVVNGEEITQEELDDVFKQEEKRTKSKKEQLSDSQKKKLKTRILEDLIKRALLFQESKNKAIIITDEEINKKVELFKQRFSNENEYKLYLKNRNMSEDKIKFAFKKDIAIKKYIDKYVVEKVEKQISISENESKKFYDDNPKYFTQPEMVRASHILVKVDSAATDSEKNKAKKLIEEIKQKLDKGDDFASLAKKHSGCPSSSKGGDLGFFGHGQMVKPFDDAAFVLKVNEISNIVKTVYGYHLIKVSDKKDKKQLSYKETKNKIVDYLKRPKIKKVIVIHLENLKKSAKIERYL